MRSPDGLNRRELLKGAGVALGGGLFYIGSGSPSGAAEIARKFDLSLPPAAPKRLSDATHALAARGISGEWGRSMVPAGIRLEDHVDLRGLSEEMRYAHALRLICERAPLRILPGERVVGSATLIEAARHAVPIYGKASVSHTTIGFHDVLRIGLKGLRERIQARRARGGLDDKGIDLLNAMSLCLEAAAVWHRRHVTALEELIAKSSGQEQAGYRGVLANLRRVPENPPACFAEAVQSLWFLYAFQRLVGNWSGIGRIDAMLGPYLKKDLAAGRITLDEARELIAHFWIKGTEWTGSNNMGGSGDAQFYQNIVLAGIDAEGREVANEVTYLVLDVVEELHISDFPIAVRLNRNSPERLLRRMAEVQRYGGGIVAMYNEEVVIEALTKFGYPLEEAREFANDGCWEALIPGKTAFIYRPFDALLCLQKAIGLDSEGAAPDYRDFDALYAAFRAELAKELEAHRSCCAGHFRDGHPATTVSMFVEGCIEKGRGYYDRGPKYVVFAPHAGGIANVANSLLAIRTLVYENKLLSLSEFVAALRGDWSGQEALRRLVLTRVPAYGNDDDQADLMVRRVYDTYTDMVAEVRELNGVLMPAGISTFGREIEWRAHRKATADGHRSGEILATNLSPSPGSDVKGPTAALKSYCKLDFTKLPNIGTLELKLLPASVKGEAGAAAMAALMRSFVKLRGCFMHIDVVDSALLLDAQRHPEKYPNLAVRIAGWSARFATLNKNWQDMVIQRTQQIV